MQSVSKPALDSQIRLLSSTGTDTLGASSPALLTSRRRPCRLAWLQQHHPLSSLASKKPTPRLIQPTRQRQAQALCRLRRHRTPELVKTTCSRRPLRPMARPGRSVGTLTLPPAITTLSSCRASGVYGHWSRLRAWQADQIAAWRRSRRFPEADCGLSV